MSAIWEWFRDLGVVEGFGLVVAVLVIVGLVVLEWQETFQKQ
jgi:hypothetical protein